MQKSGQEGSQFSSSSSPSVDGGGGGEEHPVRASLPNSLAEGLCAFELLSPREFHREGIAVVTFIESFGGVRDKPDAVSSLTPTDEASLREDLYVSPHGAFSSTRGIADLPDQPFEAHVRDLLQSLNDQVESLPSLFPGRWHRGGSERV